MPMTGRVLPPSMGHLAPHDERNQHHEGASRLAAPGPRRAANQWCHVDPNEDGPGWIVIYGNVTKSGMSLSVRFPKPAAGPWRNTLRQIQPSPFPPGMVSTAI